MKLYQRTKNQPTLSIRCRDFNLKIQQSDWLEGFRPISQETDYFKIFICTEI